jgi:hypothetical protein
MAVKPLWTNHVFSVVNGELLETGRACFVILSADGENTGKYAFSKEKAIQIALELTESQTIKEPDILDDDEIDSLLEEMEKNVIIDLHNDGKSIYQISNEFLKDPEDVRNLLTSLGVQKLFYVYVVELRKSVIKFPKMQRNNPDYVRGYPCYYVGSTRYYPEERFDIHREDGFTSVPEVRDYGIELAWDLFEDWNPFETREDAEEAEAELAEKLRSQGYGIHCGVGHPDRQ